jgi:DNA-binding response OmpR family regulator
MELSVGRWSGRRPDTIQVVTMVLLATDSDDLYDEVDAALGSADTDLLRVRTGADVVPVCHHQAPDLVVLDLQIGNMGGMATSRAIKQEQESGRLSSFPVALLLDREADVFLGSEARADGWLVKPLDSLRLRRMAATLLDGGQLYEAIATA